MSFVIYPECPIDSHRKKEIDLSSPLSKKDIYPQKGNEVCPICAPGKRVIANGNIFDEITAAEEN